MNMPETRDTWVIFSELKDGSQARTVGPFDTEPEAHAYIKRWWDAVPEQFRPRIIVTTLSAPWKY